MHQEKTYQEKTFFENYQDYVQRYMEYENRSLEDLFSEIQDGTAYLSKKGKDLIWQAFEVWKKAHTWQLRKTGKPFFTHPLTIVCMMLRYQPDAELIAATLLHDTIEDTTLSMADIKKISPVVAILVDWATKIGCGQSEDDISLTPEQVKFETIRKILSASQKDTRILFLKIFDRFHNMITISGKNPRGQKRIAEETKNIYVPLAKRCGLRSVYHSLQALCMELLEPEKWSTIDTFVHTKAPAMRAESQELQKYLQKQVWSKKIIAYHIEFLSPFSVNAGEYFHNNGWFATHLVVAEPRDCYAVLGDIGHLWDPNCIQSGKIVDFINNPRFSGYSGLHFQIIFRGFQRMKIRIVPQKIQDRIIEGRTFAELETIYASVLFRDFDLINEATASNSEAFMESVTAHVFAKKIPLHSERKPLFYMPTGLTMLDAIIYLEPEKFAFVENIYRNEEKVPFHAPLDREDIITYTFGKTRTLTKKSKKDARSGISQWRLGQLFDKEPVWNISS